MNFCGHVNLPIVPGDAFSAGKLEAVPYDRQDPGPQYGEFEK
jgi:hypothetical protein